MMLDLQTVSTGFAPTPPLSSCEVETLQATLRDAAVRLAEFNTWNKLTGRAPDDTAQMFLCFAVAVSPDEKTRMLALRCLETINAHAAAD